MRTQLLAAVLLLSGAAEAASLPDSLGCANYLEAKEPDAACDAAIAAATDPHVKSVLLFRRTYMRDAGRNFADNDSAIADLTEAIRLDSSNYSAYRERAYVYNEVGEAAKAKADLDLLAATISNEPGVYDERAFSRFDLGDLPGVLDDRNKAIALGGASVSRLVARARALMWLGRFDEASQDIKAAGDMAGQDPDQRKTVDWADKELNRWTTTSSDAAAGAQACLHPRSDADYRTDTFIGDCTTVFLTARNNADKGWALTDRATALELWMQDRSVGLDDFIIAASIDPEDPDWQFNLGSCLAAIGRYRQAMPHLNFAVARKPSGVAYAARANARYGLGDVKGALEDAKRSLETGANVVALTVLGDIAYEQLKDEKAAKDNWLAAYRAGDEDDGLKARLAKVGVSWPPSPNQLAEPAKPGNTK
jgi:tetratricopeptide (TPR) repeat protein